MKLPRRQSNSATHTPKPAKIDLWLQRVSGVAQILLSIVTLGTLYFTVVPLYQKAALEETVARLERDLKVLRVAHDESYSRLRDLAVREFVTYAGAECSGLLIPPPAPGARARQTEEHSRDALGIEATSCLMKNLKVAKALSNLEKRDFDRFSERVLMLAKELDADRVSALKEFSDVPTRVSEVESREIPLTGLSGEWDKVLGDIEVRGVGVAGRAEARHRSVIAQLQWKIIESYIKKVQGGIFQLRQMDWG